MGESLSVLTHQPCEDCGSSDALSVYDDGHTYCFSCQKYRSEHDGQPRPEPDVYLAPSKLSNWSDRGIATVVQDFYGVVVGQTTPPRAPGETITFPYYTGSEQVASKTRNPDKTFITNGSFRDCDLFGAHTILKSSKNKSSVAVLTEGESDALATFQMINRIPAGATSVNDGSTKSLVPVFSIKSGAAGAERDVRNNLELLESFERVYIIFDNDIPGQSAAENSARLLKPGKAYMVKLERKDACEYLANDAQLEFMAHVKSAQIYTPSGIVNGADAFENLWADQNLKSYPFPWQELHDRTLGVRAREIVTWAAGTGVGKSSILRELQHYYLKSTDINIGIIALEESVDRTKRGILAVEASDRLHLNEVFSKYSKEQIRKYFDATLGSGRVYLYDHFGSMDMDDLLSRVRYMVVGLGCKIIFIDHLSILVSGLDVSDERKAIDRTMTLLRQLTEETGCTIHLVTHLRRTHSDKSHESGEEINLGHLRGSHGIAQISDTVIAMERNMRSDDPVESNTTLLRVLKCRYTGDVGEAGKLFYQKQTGRMEVLYEEF